MPVKTLLNGIETSIQKYGYTSIVFQTTKHKFYSDVENVAYVNKYFFKVKTPTGEVLININNLVHVELLGLE